MYRVMGKVFKYRKGFIAGITASMVLIALMLTANFSASYAMGLKAQEMESKYTKAIISTVYDMNANPTAYKEGNALNAYKVYNEVTSKTE